FGLIFMFLTAVNHATDVLRDNVLGSPVHVHGITAKDVMDMVLGTQ
ncbi:hypothetical protein Tco_1297877, partial [Tanacetum coccineum]